MSTVPAPPGRSLHMVGIGGAGMSALARLAVQAGYRVSGSDRDESATLAALRELGVDARAGHHADAVPADVERLVVSTAISDDNPERVAARSRGVPEIHRADLLAELMDLRRGVAVAGAHGKSTTSAMLVEALGDASACVGATIAGGGGTGARWGDGPWFVAEADESDRSLLALRPQAAILLNVELDHHTTYATLEAVEQVFVDFMRLLPPDAVVVVGNDPSARRCTTRAEVATITVGGATDDWRVQITGPGTAVLHHNQHGAVPLTLRVPGDHNLSNAACAVAMASWCGVDPRQAAARLQGFMGVGRRFEHRGDAGGVTVIDDYAHHPTEVAATLAAARERTRGRVIAIFQPHLYSRTRALAGEFGAALAAADVAIVTDVYAAREPHDPTVTGRLVVDAVPVPATAIYAPELADARDAALAAAVPGDMILTLGAGSITHLGQDLVVALEKQHDDATRPRERPAAD